MGIELSERVKSVEESLVFQIVKKAKAMQKAGKTVYRFDAGEPDFPTPDNIKEAAKKAINENFTFYTSASGIEELKKAVCIKFKKSHNLDFSENEVIISVGGKQTLYNMTQALLNKGDEVILPIPYWTSHLEQIKLADATPVLVETDEKFKLHSENVEKAISEKTKLIILNSPSNPTGAIIDKKELEAIAELAIEKNILVCSDEVYEAFVYDGKKAESIACLSEEIKKRTIIVNAVSKTYSMTGWRIGYAVGPKELIKAMSAIQSHSTSNPTSIAQKAALEALTGQQESVGKMRQEFDKRRKLIVKRLNEIDGIECIMPEGSFYVFPKVSELYKDKIKNSLEFCDYVLETEGVSIVPGISAGADEYVRFSYASSQETIEKGMDAFEKAVKKIIIN